MLFGHLIYLSCVFCGVQISNCSYVLIFQGANSDHVHWQFKSAYQLANLSSDPDNLPSKTSAKTHATFLSLHPTSPLPIIQSAPIFLLFSSLSTFWGSLYSFIKKGPYTFLPYSFNYFVILPF